MFKRLFDMKEDNLDEREIQVRGVIYRNAFLLTVSLLLINTALYERGILWSEARYCNTMTILAAAIFVCVAQLRAGIYPISLLAQKGFCIFCAQFGILCIGVFIYEVAAGELIFVGMALSVTGTTLLMAIFMFLPLIFLAVSRKKLSNEE